MRWRAFVAICRAPSRGWCAFGDAQGLAPRQLEFADPRVMRAAAAFLEASPFPYPNRLGRSGSPPPDGRGRLQERMAPRPSVANLMVPAEGIEPPTFGLQILHHRMKGVPPPIDGAT